METKYKITLVVGGLVYVGCWLGAAYCFKKASK